MKVKEAAALLEISVTCVYSLCAAGALGHSRLGIGRGTIRIEPADIEAFKVAARAKAAPKHPAPVPFHYRHFCPPE